VDLQCHTSFSPDSTTSPARLVERAREVGLDRIAVTDHGEVKGALLAHRLAPELIIVGEEVRCADRTELIGLFLRERIPPGLPLEETAARIRAQGGVVYLPHPYAYLTWPTFRAERALAVADAVEAFNARAFWPSWNRRARHAGADAGLPLGAGSDAHFPGEVGRAYTELPDFAGPEEFRAALGSARPVGQGLSSPAVHLASAALKVARRLTAAPEDARAGGYDASTTASFGASAPSRGGPAMG
jgi:predicted metal-dependent phosphoesterase TrpH